jgi:hypothetical protein
MAVEIVITEFRKNHRRRSVNGVMKFLVNKGVTDKKHQNEIVLFFCAEQHITLPMTESITEACVHIQARWEIFKQWIAKEKIIE